MTLAASINLLSSELFFCLYFIILINMPYSLYSKPYRQPIDLISDLKGKNLLFINEHEAEKILSQISYYHFKIYLHPMLDLNGTNPKVYRSNSFFESGVELYRFDEELRILMFKAIAKIEVKLRSRLDHLISRTTSDPFWYLDNSLFFIIRNNTYAIDSIRDKISNDFNREKELYASNYRSKYYNDKHHKYKNLPPFWIASELLSLGQIYKIYDAMNHSLPAIDFDNLAKEFGAKDYKVLVNWIRCIRDVRNRCAHHSRLWNAKLSIPSDLNNVLTISSPNKHRPYTTIAVIQKIIKKLRIQNFDLREELETIFNRYPFAKNHMHQAGFPTNWSTDPLWVKKWKNPPIFILTTSKLNMMTNR